jgi:hypothetical protein
MDFSILNLYSDYIPPEDLVVRFKYRIVSISNTVYEAVSNTSAESLNNISNKKEDSYSKLLLLDSKYKNIIYYINIIPLSYDFKDYGVLLTNKYNYEYLDNKEKITIIGSLFKYTDDINILIYDYNLFTYKGIIFKKGYEYLKFTDIIINNNKKIVYNHIKHNINNYDYIEGYDLIRVITDDIIYIKNNKMILIERKLKNKLIVKDNRDLNYNKKNRYF